jgi:hypothetical protein
MKAPQSHHQKLRHPPVDFPSAANVSAAAIDIRDISKSEFISE